MINIPGIHVTFDNWKEIAFIVEHEGHVYRFKQCGRGLYYYDIDKKNKTNVNEYTSLQVVQTVRDNEAMYSKKDIAAAKAVTSMQRYFF